MKTILQLVYFALAIFVIQQRCRALHGNWTDQASACIRGYNNAELEMTTIEACQEKCEQQDDFRCLSVDFNPSSNRCLLSRYNRNSVPSTDDFTQPCYSDGWVYSERQDLDFPWSQVVLGCIRKHNEREYTASSMEECQLLCEQETSFPCLSVDFRDEQCLLSRYNRESLRPLSDYTQPCYLDRYEYSERIDRQYFWTRNASACIRGHNNEVHNNIDNFEDCQDLCLQETSFPCLSIDFFPSTSECLLSSFNRNSVDENDFTQPCYTSVATYVERVDIGQWTPIMEEACVSGFNEHSVDVEDFESCKILCSQRSNCCSVDYKQETKRCYMTSRTRATVDESDFNTPCNGFSYSERTDVRCVVS